MSAVASRQKQGSKTLPIIEVFGPTIQGEGAEAGLPCYFVRLGGCDFRCSWCDTMYAVDPAQVRANSTRMTTDDVVQAVSDLSGNARWVILSGGNPALHELGALVEGLHGRGRQVAVETQGSIWKDWLGFVDRLTVSPKPPSSGMASERHETQLRHFMGATSRTNAPTILKVVCFDEPDLDWAKRVASEWPDVPLFLSAGTPVPSPPDLRGAVAARYRWLCERVATDPDLGAARVLPQLHVIAWGDATGV